MRSCGNALLWALPVVATAALGCASTSTIHTTPPDAAIYINGEECNESPCIYHSRYGFPDRMRVQLHKPGYEAAEFFVDTQAHIFSYFLFGFGAYILNAFEKDYHFKLDEIDAPSSAPMSPPLTPAVDGSDPPAPLYGPAPALPDPAVIANAIEQCQFWQERTTATAANDWAHNQRHLHCSQAKQWTGALRTSGIELPPKAAGWLVETNTGSDVITPEICQLALVDFARQQGGGRRAFSAFQRACPQEHRRLVAE